MEELSDPYPKRINHRCPLCGETMVDNQLDILKTQNDNLIVFSSCTNCGVGMVARLAVMNQGLFGLGILTDMERDEVLPFRGLAPVSAQDVLDVKLLTDRGLLEIRL